MLIPMVIEETTRGERAYDIYSRLLKDHILFGKHCRHARVAAHPWTHRAFPQVFGVSESLCFQVRANGVSE